MNAHPVLELVRPVRALLLTAVTLQAAAASLTVIPLIALAEIVGRAISTPPTGGIPPDAAPLVVAAVIALVSSVVLATAATALAHLADSILQLRLQRDLASALTTVPLATVTGRGAGRIAKVVKDDVAGLHHLVAHTALDLTTVAVAPAAGIVALVVIDWRSAVLSLAMLLLGAGFFVHAMRGSGAKFAAYAAAQSDINAAIVGYVHGIATAKIFNGTHGARSTVTRATDAFHDFFRAWSSSTATSTTASWLIVAPALTVTVFTAAATLSVVNGWAPTEAVIALLLIGPAIAAPVAVIGPRLQAIRTGSAAAASIAAVLDEPPLVWGAGGATPEGSSIRFEDVTFGYGPAGQRHGSVLAGVSFTLPQGSTSALVGSSGAGKTTIASLLARFADPDAGTVSVGGTPLGELSARQLYDLVGFAFQDVVLTAGSVRDNLTGGRPLPAERVAAAARAAAIHDHILGLPRGYDTIVGAETELSGGQAQRLGIARALLRDTSVLVLDEPTAAADPLTQAAVHEGLAAHTSGRTTLTIAHRLDTITHVDQILVVDHGTIAERGTHPQLLAAGGLYTSMWNAQHPGTDLR